MFKKKINKWKNHLASSPPGMTSFKESRSSCGNQSSLLKASQGTFQLGDNVTRLRIKIPGREMERRAERKESSSARGLTQRLLATQRGSPEGETWPWEGAEAQSWPWGQAAAALWPLPAWPHLDFTGEPSRKRKFWHEITGNDKSMKTLEPSSPYCHPLGYEKIC